jgi:hypothetical protein
MMISYKLTASTVCCALALAAAPLHAATIASENFEGGASGWSNNLTEDPGPNGGGFTRHLGRHGQGGTTSKTFALSGAQSTVSVGFDFYRIDSWDGELFQATISDGTSSFTNSTAGFFFDGGPTNIYNGSWSDAVRAISFNFATTASSITLTFSSTLDQGFTDEAWGVDNLLITDNLGSVPGVPEPSAWALFILGFGVVGAGLRARRRASQALAYGTQK